MKGRWLPVHIKKKKKKIRARWLPTVEIGLTISCDFLLNLATQLLYPYGVNEAGLAKKKKRVCFGIGYRYFIIKLINILYNLLRILKIIIKSISKKVNEEIKFKIKTYTSSVSFFCLIWKITFFKGTLFIVLSIF